MKVGKRRYLDAIVAISGVVSIQSNQWKVQQRETELGSGTGIICNKSECGTRDQVEQVEVNSRMANSDR